VYLYNFVDSFSLSFTCPLGKITGGLHPNLTRFEPYKLHVHKKYTKLTSPNPLFALSRGFTVE